MLINARSTVDVDFLKSSAVYSGLDAETEVVRVGGTVTLCGQVALEGGAVRMWALKLVCVCSYPWCVLARPS